MRRIRDRGATTVEYALGLSLAALVAFSAVQFASQQTDAMFDRVMNETSQPRADDPTPPPTTMPTTTTTAPCRRWCR